MKLNQQSGFSLIELMCAILILGVGLVGLGRGITNALGSSKEAEIQTAASLIAAGRIETLRAESYIVEGETIGDCGEDLPLYRWKESIRPTQIDGLFEVEIVVENSKTGASLYELQTMLFDVPLSSSESSTKKGSSDSRRKRRNRE